MASFNYDYDLQVWVNDGVIEDCGHPDHMKETAVSCCNAHRFAGMKIDEVNKTFTKITASHAY